jgi:hypothetical protein
MRGPRGKPTSHTAVAEGERRGGRGGWGEGRGQKLALSWSGIVPVSRMASLCPQHGARNMPRWWPEVCW